MNSGEKIPRVPVNARSLRIAIARHEISVRKLATMAGVSRSALAIWLLDGAKAAHRVNVEAVAQVLKVPMEVLTSDNLAEAVEAHLRKVDAIAGYVRRRLTGSILRGEHRA